MTRGGVKLSVCAATCLAVVICLFILPTRSVAQRRGQDRGPKRAMARRYAPGRVLVKLRPRRPAADLLQAVAPQGMRLKQTLPGTDWVALELPEGLTPPEAARRLRGRPEVELATPDVILYALDIQPNDPFCNAPDWPMIEWCS